jgi:DNA-binding NtrC family response regulator
VNCAGLTDSLLGSHLFGHKRGAFTGAIEDQQGVFETAQGGSVFLDEIGDISSNVQTSLLRVLQEREITRLGEVRPRKVDVRIIAATLRDLSREVEEERFRIDLLYRIRVARIQLPPLRARRADIPLLAESFLRRFRATTGKPVERVGEEALSLLLNHTWPGNVRELQSAIEFAVIRCKGSVIWPDDLPPELSGSLFGNPDLPGSEEDERARILAALETAHGKRTAAARLLGMSRSTLYRRLAELEIEVE